MPKLRVYKVGLTASTPVAPSKLRVYGVGLTAISPSSAHKLRVYQVAIGATQTNNIFWRDGSVTRTGRLCYFDGTNTHTI